MSVTRATVKKFLRKNKIGVLATITKDNIPVTAPVFYLYTDDGRVKFITKNQTTKYENMIRNSNVGISVVDRSLPIAVNLTGRAKLIESNEEIKKSFKEIGKIQIADYIQPVIKHRKGDFVVFEVTLLKIQYTDYTKPFDSDEENIFDL